MRARAFLWPLAVAAALRFSGLGWDGWTHQHPDERFLVMVAERLDAPKSLTEALDPYRTPFNPQNRGFSFFVYGALVPSLHWTVAQALGIADYTGLLKTGRALSAFFDCLALLFLAGTAARLGGPRAGTTVAWLYACSGILIQNARFGTADALGLLATSFTLWGIFHPLSWQSALLAGVGVGVAAATRPNLVLLALPVTAAGLLLPSHSHPWRLSKRILWLLGAGLVTLGVWKLLDPGFFAAPFSPLPNPRRLASLVELAGMMRGEGQFPPNLQWVGRGPLFLAWNAFFWGVGPALGLVLLWAFVRGGVRALALERQALVVFSWLLPQGLLQATSFVASVRHFLPSLPFLFLLAVPVLRRWPLRWQRAVVVGTVPWGVAWAVLAWQPYTRLEASAFLRRTFPQGTVIAVEAWDDALPLGWNSEGFRFREVPVYAGDTQEKRETLLEILEEADVIALSSQRGVGSICRVPDAYPLMAEFYHLLFSGQLGFRLVHHQERKLGWGFWGLSHLAAEEALSVYDHPPVWIFAKDPHFEIALAKQLLGRIPLPENTHWETRHLQARGLPPYLLKDRTLNPLPLTWGRGVWGQVMTVVLWVVVLEWVGVLATLGLGRLCHLPPLSAALLARPVGLLAVGMVVLWGGALGLPGWQAPLPLAMGLAATWRWRGPLRAVWASPETRWARVWFLACLAAFLSVRALNPEVYWGEKPMDSAILATLLRCPSLPPPDPWFAGHPINYYFFGFLPYTFLARVAGATPAVAFNLAAATVPALAFLAAGAGGFALSQRRSGAVFAGTLTQLVGTGYLLRHPSALLAPTFDHFWSSSRVIPDTINEYPVWTALFADLHAHFLSMPGFLATVALLIHFLTTSHRRSLQVALALCLASQSMSNSWETPALVVLFLATVLFRDASRKLGMVRAARCAAFVFLGAGLFSLPFLLGQSLPRASLSWEPGPSGNAASYLELYGVHGVVFLATLLAGWSQLSNRRLRAFVLVAGAVVGVLIFGPQLFTLADKMNTYFKLGLQAFLLLGTLGGGLWGASLGPGGYPGKRVAQGVAAFVAAAGFIQGLWGAWAVVTTRRVPGPRPTLDGQAYLRYAAPAVAAAVEACQENNLRTVAEQARPPYGDTLRLPMFCGVQALVGWEYHLWQRGKSWAEIGLRLQDQEVLFRGQPATLAQALARRWQVEALAHWEKTVQMPGCLPVHNAHGHCCLLGKPN